MEYEDRGKRGEHARRRVSFFSSKWCRHRRVVSFYIATVLRRNVEPSWASSEWPRAAYLGLVNVHLEILADMCASTASTQQTERSRAKSVSEHAELRRSCTISGSLFIAASHSGVRAATSSLR